MAKSAWKACSLFVALVAAILGGVPARAWHHCADHHPHNATGRPAELARHTHCDHDHGDTARVPVDCGACANSFASSFLAQPPDLSLDRPEALESCETTLGVVVAIHFESHPVRGPPLA